MPRRKSTKRGKGEGSVFELPNSIWRGKVTTGYDDAGKHITVSDLLEYREGA